MLAIDQIGADWASEYVGTFTEELLELSPVEFNEKFRYIPPSISRFGGPLDMSLTPYWIEILECMDIRSPVREVSVMKGVQVAYTTLGIEAPIFYVAGHLRTLPVLFATMDKEMMGERMEENIIPMFQYSDMDIFQSADIGNSRKTGKTKNHLQWKGGGYLIPYGANNISKIRSFSMQYVFMDEIDAETWGGKVTGGGDKIALFKKRARAFWEVRKIMMGSTPLIEGTSRIEREFKRGDQRAYKCRCLKCGYPQHLRWNGVNKETGKEYGFKWEYNAEGQVDVDTVRYHCKNCNHEHFEHDKPKFISKENCFWKPTATPVEPNIRSYHVPSFLSPAGLGPWYEIVNDWVSAVDPKTGKVRDIDLMQSVYNNHFGVPFKLLGGRVRFEAVSAHRRRFYFKGQIPNREIEKCCDSGILFLTCTVDVHKDNLAVAVWGWTAGFTCWLIDYQRFKDDSENGCEEIKSPAWGRLQDMIDNGVWTADNGKQYRLAMTLIDSSWNTSIVVEFCQQWEFWVFPIMGRERPAKAQTIKEFAEFTTQAGTIGYRILVDHYKDRLAPVLRRDWHPSEGSQSSYTFNAPLDTDDDELKELTKEYRRKKEWPNGYVTYYWHRPHGAQNELWDLMVYGHCSVEILAWWICVREHQMEGIDWYQFWEYCKSGVFWREAA